MRHFVSILLVVVLITATVPTATACINDRESKTHEKEFKSNYLKQPASPSPSSTPYNLLTVVASGVGATALVFGVAIGTMAVVRRRGPTSE